MATKVEPARGRVCTGGAVRQPPIDQDVIYEKDVVYAEVGSRRLMLDVARPSSGKGPYPLLLVFPGNGWGYFFWFDRKTYRKEILAAASQGFVAASIDCRPAITAGFQAELDDAHASLEWLRAHAAALEADPERIVLTGFSSGGQLALLVALKETQASSSSRGAVKAIVTTAAPADMFAFESRRFLGFAVRRLMRGGPEKVPERYRLASPATKVRSDMPPVLMLHGSNDRLVPVEQSLILDAALTYAHVRHELVLTPHCGHRDQWRNPAVWSFLAQRVGMSTRELR